MKVLFVAGEADSGHGVALRSLAVGAAHTGYTVLLVGSNVHVPAVRHLYTIKSGERIAPIKVDLVVLDEVDDELRKLAIAAFRRGSPGPLLVRLGAILSPTATLVVGRHVSRSVAA